MRRREFVRIGALLVPLGAALRGWSAAPGPRAAVAIGVNKTSGGALATLSSAASGARDIAAWLTGEGFEVKTFVDDTAPVTVNDVYQAIEEFVGRGTLTQLVVFFSGHGVNLNQHEHWLLSKAPGNPNESVSLTWSVENARASAIPSVVFVSDACRTIGGTTTLNSLNGGSIFPGGSATAPAQDVEVDRFLASRVGAPAYELPEAISLQKQGVFTRVFLDAYDKPDQSMVTQVGGVDVVPNRSLKDYLVREVSSRVQTYSLAITQQPQCIVECGQPTYIGRVRNNAPRAVAAERTPTLADVTNLAMVNAGAEPLSPDRPVDTQKVELASRSSGFDLARTKILTATSVAPTSFETGTGLSILGAEVVSCIVTGGEQGTIHDAGSADGARPAVVTLPPKSASVLVQFKDGSAAPVAALQGYIASIVVKNGGVAAVNYSPARNGPHGYAFDPAMEPRLNELRAAVATAAEYGAFRFEGDPASRARDANRFADRIRVMKGVDPTLGIYAAYAYAEAGVLNQIRSVYDIMSGDLGARVFDVSMLARKLPDAMWTPAERGTFPFCPMLSQGWEVLRAYGVKLPDVLVEARAHIRPSLWTTFSPEAVPSLTRFVAGGA